MICYTTNKDLRARTVIIPYKAPQKKKKKNDVLPYMLLDLHSTPKISNNFIFENVRSNTALSGMTDTVPETNHQSRNILCELYLWVCLIRKISHQFGTCKWPSVSSFTATSSNYTQIIAVSRKFWTLPQTHNFNPTQWMTCVTNDCLYTCCTER